MKTIMNCSIPTNRREFLKGLGALGMLTIAGPRALAGPVTSGFTDQPPNFVLVMADDMGWGDLAANGSNKIVKTPNLDAMAAAGVRLTWFYTASPLCSPTRAGFLSGRHPTRYGCYVPKDTLPGDELTIPELLRPSGYVTGHFGKWHIGDLVPNNPTSPAGQGFDTNFSVYNSYRLPKMDVTFSRHGKSEKTTGYCEDVIMGEAIKFIRANVAAKKPFLAVVWTLAPHSPDEAPDRCRQPYAQLPEKDQQYWGMISAIDENMGRLRATLRELGVADNTFVLFTSDNGGTGLSRAHAPFSGSKGTVQEGGFRVPGIVEWRAKLAKPAVCDIPVTTCDILPTVLGASGAGLPKDARTLDGVNVLPALTGEWKERPTPFVLHFDEGGKRREKFGGNGFAVVDNRFKLLAALDNSRAELYDVVADPGEKQRGRPSQGRVRQAAGRPREMVGQRPGRAGIRERREEDKTTVTRSGREMKGNEMRPEDGFPGVTARFEPSAEVCDSPFNPPAGAQAEPPAKVIFYQHMNRFVTMPLMLLVCAVPFVQATGPTTMPFDLITPEMTDDEPGPGKRVRQVAPEYKGTAVYHALYLPRDWKPTGKCPVIVEYTGNKWAPCGSTGEAKDANLGYGMSGGQGFIWVSMPFVAPGGKENAISGLGDKKATVDYCKVNLPRICQQFGGDLNNVFICGFSRGAMAASQIGLADDKIAALWKGMFTHDHFDNSRERLARLKGRPVLVCGKLVEYPKKHLDLARFTFLDVPTEKLFAIPEGKVIHPHTDLWMHKESEYRQQARAWIAGVLKESSHKQVEQRFGGQTP